MTGNQNSSEGKKRLLLVAHAPSPNTERLRDAIAAGVAAAESKSVDLVVRSPFDTGPDDVMAAQAIILFTTENLGYMSGAMKDFFDRTYYPVLEEKQGLAYMLIVRAGHDGTGTCRAVETVTTGLRWKAVQEPLVCRGDWDEAFVGQCHEAGMLMAAGLDAGIF
jgi:multimeric flavodoxin WrbA